VLINGSESDGEEIKTSFRQTDRQTYRHTAASLRVFDTWIRSFFLYYYAGSFSAEDIGRGERKESWIKYRKSAREGRK
jgi:hypothetical protein